MSSSPMDREIARLLAEGQDAARRGDQAMARTLLTQLVEKDPHNEEAWMWLSGVVSDPAEQQICLENALVINPYNSQARKGVEFLATKTGNPAHLPPLPPTPSASASPVFDPGLLAGAGAPTPMEPSSPLSPMPESWAVPGPQPADPFVAAAPYPAPPEPSGANSNGHPGINGPAIDLAGTVPYTAPEPAPSDYSFAANNPGEPRPGGPGGTVNGTGTGDFMQAGGMAFDAGELGFDAQPFVPPGLGDAARPGTQGDSGFVPLEGKLAHEDTATDLPAWLENLTPSAPTGESHEPSFGPYDMAGFGGPSAMSADNGMNGMNGGLSGLGAQDPNMPFGPTAGHSAPQDMPQMSPFSDMRLPSPDELPGGAGDRSGSGQAQPWYLQGSASSSAPPMPTGGISNFLDSSMLNSTSLGGGKAGAAVLEEKRNRSGATIQCPNCEEQVPDTSLACPNCQYNFFVNCPYCHELVDTADATPGQVEPCPYCKKSINRMELGMGGVQDLVSQKNPGSRPAAAASMTVAFPAMQQDIPGLKAPRRGMTFDWVVDLLWLIAIVMMVWALTQLPTWLNLPGMY